MKVAYIAGPYRAPTVRGIVENIRTAEAVALKYWRDGYAVICPHMNSALFDGSAPDSVWIEGGKELLRRCDVIVMMGDWLVSTGAKEELALACEVGLEVIYESPGGGPSQEAREGGAA